WESGEYITNANWYLRASPFRPEHVQYLRDLYQDLAAYDIDGIMFQDDLYLAWNEDFSDYAKSAYQSRFGRELDPLAMYDEDGGPTPEGWEWAHWKAEQLVSLVSEVMDAVHSVNPDVKCALDTYYESVLEPDNGLVWFGQDVQLAVEQGCDYIAVMSYHRGIAEERGLTIDQAIQLLGAMTQEAMGLAGVDAVVMKVQTEDFETGEVLPTWEIGDVMSTLSDAGCRNIAYYPHRSDLPFGVIRCHFAGTLFGDLDGDGEVTVADIMQVASRWRCRCTDACYDPRYDMDGDCDIDIVDIMLVAAHWGDTCGGTAASVGPSPDRSEADVSPTVRLDPADPTVEVGSTFTVTVMIDEAVDLGAFQFDLHYTPAIVQVEAITPGDFLASTGRAVSSVGPSIDNDAGFARFGGFSFGTQPGPNGSGALALVRLRAVGAGTSPLDLERVQVLDTLVHPQVPRVEDGSATVEGGAEHRIHLPLALKDYHVQP
ncbi:MAG: poly-beta-1,6-N-acetyl-D-glucosamine N-deacetylase PgaB, partial [Anaerolineae bacterium]